MRYYPLQMCVLVGATPYILGLRWKWYITQKENDYIATVLPMLIHLTMHIQEHDHTAPTVGYIRCRNVLWHLLTIRFAWSQSLCVSIMSDNVIRPLVKLTKQVTVTRIRVYISSGWLFPFGWCNCINNSAPAAMERTARRKNTLKYARILCICHRQWSWWKYQLFCIN